jgi:murein DD-endopeptidase MepM/ murein hydrolase activator NlpD
MKFRAGVPIALACLLVAALQLSAKGSTRDAWSVEWEPAQLVNGSPVLFRVTAPAALGSLRGTWSGRELAFRFSQACNCWYAIAGIGLNSRAGKHPLRLEGSGKNNVNVSFTREVTVSEKRYPETSLSVAPEYVQPPQDVQARIAKEEALKKRLFSEPSQEALWSGRFGSPVESSVSGGFGSARIYNGVKKRQHEGLDFHAAIGTIVRASNRGTVILARNLYFEGNCVVLDHGQGLLTLYFHLSEIKVKEGDQVERSQVLGSSGNTGRVTAPHLHFAVRWQGLYLDPETLLQLGPP